MTIAAQLSFFAVDSQKSTPGLKLFVPVAFQCFWNRQGPYFVLKEQSRTQVRDFSSQPALQFNDKDFAAA
jgi:hypothetical protein